MPQSPSHQALLSRALYYLQIRQRSEQEMTSYLQKKGGQVADVDKVLTYLKQHGLINDQEFAAAYTRSLFAKGKGEAFIAYQLSRKFGVAKPLISEAVQAFDSKLRVASAIKVLERKSKILAMPKPLARLKANQYLANRGYSTDVRRCAIDEVFADE